MLLVIYIYLNCIKNCREDTIEALRAILRYKYIEPEDVIRDVIRALRAIWRSIPDSHMCRREFFDVFSGVAADFDKLKTISEAYAKFVCEDDFAGLPQLRSLAHYSRCRIRQVLREHKQLPDGVRKLPVPRLLKDYLLLEL